MNEFIMKLRIDRFQLQYFFVQNEVLLILVQGSRKTSSKCSMCWKIFLWKCLLDKCVLFNEGMLGQKRALIKRENPKPCQDGIFKFFI